MTMIALMGSFIHRGARIALTSSAMRWPQQMSA